MRLKPGQTAVVTGAASGIGRALAGGFARRGLNVVACDVDRASLGDAAHELEAWGGGVLPVTTDVSSLESVQAAATSALERFGQVDVLCNNAGVAAGGAMADLSIERWEWVLGVNLWGVINGITTFLPAMLASGRPGHVLNTASVAGFLPSALSAPYASSKAAVIALSESLQLELTKSGAQVGVSVLCPGWVRTRLADSIRHRPDLASSPSRDEEARSAAIQVLLEQGESPDEVAEVALGAIEGERFYAFTDARMIRGIARRTAKIVEGRNPGSTTRNGFFDAHPSGRPRRPGDSETSDP